MRSHARSLAMLCSLAVALGPSPAATAQTSPQSSPSAAPGDVSAVIIGLGDPRDARAVLEAADGGDVTVLDHETIVVEVTDAAAAIQALRHEPGVRYVEPDWPLATTASAPNDPLFRDLWGLHNTGQFIGSTPAADIAALAAWEAWDAIVGTDVVVAVTDTGIDGTHPDLAPRMWRNDGSHTACPLGTTGFDFVTNACTADGTDPNGHGTHVAGTIGAAVGNGIGIAGVAPAARLLDLRMMDASGSGQISTAVAAVNLATTLANRGVPVGVLNASWASSSYSTALRNAIAAAGDAGILVVAAAGNDGRDVDSSPTYPCALPLSNVVCVAASTFSDSLASYSNYGSVSVDLAAPGSHIRSTWPGARYAFLNGTSMAAPHVAGVAAMLAGSCVASTADIRTALLDGVDRPVPLTGTTASQGRLDAAASFDLLGCTGVLQPPGPPSPLLIGPTHPWIRWAPGGADRFTLQHSAPGADTFSDLVEDLTTATAATSTLPEGRMALRVIATRHEQSATSTTAAVVVDRTPPTIALTGCPVDPVPAGSVAKVQVTAGDGLSGLATDPSGVHQLSTTSGGTSTATFTATDRVGLSASAQCTYSVTGTSGGTGGGGSTGGGGGATGGGALPAHPPPAEIAPADPDPAADEPATDEPTDEPVDAPSSGPVPGDDPAVLVLPPRVDAGTPALAALAVSQLRFPTAAPAFAQTGGRMADHAVIARDDEFADALAGASLTGDGPLLLTSADRLDRGVADELGRLLPPASVVYLLGGTTALSADIAQAIVDLDLIPIRLAGPSRIETALQIAEEVIRIAPSTTDVMLARAYGLADNATAAWADAISGGAYGASTTTPLLLTATDALHPAVADWIADTARRPVLLGGTAALAATISTALPHSSRVQGDDRAATAVAVAVDLWQVPTPLASALLINGWHDRGWAYGLIGAGLAADADAPLLLINDPLPPATASALDCATATTVLGDPATVDAATLALPSTPCPD